MDRHFYLQEQYDGKILDFMPEQKEGVQSGHVHVQRTNGKVPSPPPSGQTIHLYRLRPTRTRKLEIQPDQPTGGGHRLPASAQRRSTTHLLDRRYAAKDTPFVREFYCPDYSKKPMPDVKDYRRTLYWTPKVKFNDKGEAVIQLYNNSKKTVITVEAEGITTDGKPVVWKSEQIKHTHVDLSHHLEKKCPIHFQNKSIPLQRKHERVSE